MERNLSLSYSKINTFLECPKKFYFQYILKLPSKPKYYFSFGETIHQILEFMYNPKLNSSTIIPRLEKLVSLVDEYWIGEGYWDETQEIEAKNEARRIILEYYKKNIFSYRPAFSVEERFSFNIDNIQITGKIDRIDKLPSINNFEILDYKTGNDIFTNPDRVDFISKLQLIIYSLGFNQKYNQEVKSVGWYFLRKNIRTNVNINETDYIDAKALIVKVYNEIMNENYFKCQGMKCQYCDYIEKCNSDI